MRVGQRSNGHPTCRQFLSALCWCLAWNASVIGSIAVGESLPLQGRRVAGLRLADGSDAVAQISSPTRVQYFVGKGDQWSETTVTLGSGDLVPGAPLVLRHVEGQQLPQVLTIGAAGRLLQVTPRANGLEIAPIDAAAIPPRIQFPPGGNFAIASRPKRLVVFAVDRDGTLWEFDPKAGEPTSMEGRSGLLVPGGAVGTLPDEGDEVFLIDRRGNLVSYIRDPIVRWKGPRLIGADFVAGTDISVWRRPENQRELQVAAVNARGELQIGRWEQHGWLMEIAPGWLFPAGSPVAIAHTPVNMRFCGVTAKGTLLEMHLENTEWRERTIAEGFAWKSNAVVLPHGPLVLGIDAAGQFISAVQAQETWTVRITVADPAVKTARLVQREWKPSAAGATQEIEFVNLSAEELIVRIDNPRDPGLPMKLRVAPSSTFSLGVPMDSSGTLQDVIRPLESEGTTSDQARTVRTPPQCLYDLEVLAVREENIAYLDARHIRRRSASHVPSPISLGRFAIPSATALPPGARVDLLKSAAARQLSSTVKE